MRRRLICPKATRPGQSCPMLLTLDERSYYCSNGCGRTAKPGPPVTLYAVHRGYAMGVPRN